MSKKTEAVNDSKIEVRESGIQVSLNSPRVVELPLIVTLPSTASKAQIAFAKVINGFAYVNPIQWEARKEELLSKLEKLESAPDPVEKPNDGARVSVGPDASKDI